MLLRKTHRGPLLNQSVGPAVGLGREACKHIVAAIQDKADHYAAKEKQNLLLAVDMLETPGHLLKEITCRLDAAWIESLGFREIWLVGLTPSLCVKLHPR